MEKTSNYEVVLRPSTGWGRFDWKGLWQYRDLLSLMVWRDISVKYRQTALGPLWFILQPLLPTLIFTVIFGKVAGLPTEGLPPLIFYLANQLAWSCFALNFTATSNIFGSNLNIFSKVYFPRLIVPLSSVISNFAAIAVQFAAFLGFFAWHRWFEGFSTLTIPWTVVFIPLIAAYLALLGLACGLWMSALTAKYRDLTQAAPVLVQALMFGTPVIVPLSYFPAHWLWLVMLNPVAFPVELFRWALLGRGTLGTEYAIASGLLALILLLSGLRLFGKVERNFVDLA